MTKIYGYIYKITNLVNNKIYIGQTTVTVQKRWQSHNWACVKNKSNMAITNAIIKYGKENFTIEQIDIAYSQQELNILEGVYISWFNSLSPNGYNIIKIINGKGKHSEITKIKFKQIANKPTKIKQSSENGKKLKQTKYNFTSKYIGVTKKGNYWYSRFKHNYKEIRIGSFYTEEDAALAYDINVIKILGINCKLNFPENKQKYINNLIKLPSRNYTKTKIKN